MKKIKGKKNSGVRGLIRGKNSFLWNFLPRNDIKHSLHARLKLIEFRRKYDWFTPVSAVSLAWTGGSGKVYPNLRQSKGVLKTA